MKKIFILALVLVGLPLLIWFVDRAGLIYWAGNNDLLIEFVVTDVESGLAIEDAEIYVLSEGGLYEGANTAEEVFTLLTNAEGSALRECKESLCYGTQSLFRFTNTYNIHLPEWRAKASAPGYEPTPAWAFVGSPENRGAVQHQNGKKDKLVVRLTLARKRLKGSSDDSFQRGK